MLVDGSCKHLRTVEVLNPEHGHVCVGDDRANAVEWCTSCGALRMYQNGTWQGWIKAEANDGKPTVPPGRSRSYRIGEILAERLFLARGIADNDEATIEVTQRELAVLCAAAAQLGLDERREP